MRFQPAPLAGVYVIESEAIHDDRGFFARTWCREEFAAHGLDVNLAQSNLSFNRLRGTLRGMHFQYPPHAEVKLVRCMRGRILDVAVDLRPHSPTFLHWFAAELSDENLRAFYIPPGFAHGFQTLADETLIAYQMSAFYAPQAAGGLRWNDARVGITWPEPVTCIAPRDAGYPDIDDAFIAGLACFDTEA